jgi:RHS repeat-associated protein
MKSSKQQTTGKNGMESARKLCRFIGCILPLITIFLAPLSPVRSTAAELITVGGGTGSAVTEPQPAPPADSSTQPTDSPASLPADTATPATGTDTSTPTADTSLKPTGKATTQSTSLASTATSSSDPAAGDGYNGAVAVTSVNNSIFTGAATTSIPIAVPPGRKGIVPALALIYNSMQGNGWIGVGWGLDMGSIQRSTKKGVHYTGAGSDDFVFTVNGSATELVARSDWGSGYYGAKIEGEFSKFYRNAATDQWVVTGKDGTTYYYGTTLYDSTLEGRQFNNTIGTFKWCLVWVQDSNGNYMKISYETAPLTDPGALYLKQIDYTGNSGAALGTTNRVVFLRESRTDVSISYTPHWPVATASRLKYIVVTATSDGVNWQLVRQYQLNYPSTNTSTSRSLLTSVVQYGSNGSSTLPATTFTYSVKENAAEVDIPTVHRTYSYNSNGLGFKMADVNGDGLADLVYDSDDTVKDIHVLLGTGKDLAATGFAADAGWGKRLAGYNTNGGGFKMADVNGDGFADLVYDSDDSVKDIHVMLSTGAGFAADAPLGKRTYSYNTNGGGFQMVDVNGDGFADLVYDSDDSVKDIHVMLSTGTGFAATGFAADAGWGKRLASYNTKGGGFKMADVNGDGLPDLVYDGDDGYIHVMLNRGTYFDADVPWGKRAYSYNTNGGGFQMVDVNGDGLADLVYDSDDPVKDIHVMLSTGTGFAADAPWGKRTHSYNTNGGGFRMVDVNGDGLPDLVYDSDDNVGGDIHVLLNRGTYFDVDAPWGDRTASYNTSGYGFRMADVDGHGLPDLIYDSSDNGSYIRLLKNKHPVPDLLIKVTNSMGGSTAIAYGQSNINVDSSVLVMQTVSSIAVTDGYGNIATTSYTYSGGVFNVPNREFRGFATVTQTNPDNTQVETKFYQDDWNKGRQYLVTTKSSSSGHATLGTTSLSWDPPPTNNPAWAFVKLNSKRTDLIENGISTVFTQENYTYDSNTGFPLTTTTSGTGMETVTTTNTYWNSPWLWLWRLASTTVTGSTSGQVRQNTFGYENTTGNLKWKESWLKDGTNPRVDILSYDCGNPKSVKDARGFTTTTEYDTFSHTYPVKVTSPATTDNPAGLSQSHISERGGYDYRFGAPGWSKDENGKFTYYSYDTFGRPILVTYPDGGQITTAYHNEVFPNYHLTTVNENTAGQTMAKYQYFDGLGRANRTTTFGEAGRQIDSTVYYDNMGRVFLTNGPYFPIDASGTRPASFPWTQTTYDDRGRPLAVKSPASTTSTATTNFSYSGLATTITDPDLKKKTATKDPLGRLIQVTEYNGTTQYQTNYSYNAAGDLLSVTDSSNNLTLIKYDTLGRKTSMSDPDMGSWSYTYDANGNLLTQTDAKAQTVTFVYDELNRITSKGYTSADPTVTYVYDSPDITNGLGRLFSVSNSMVTTATQAYDPMGRVKSQWKTISGKSNPYSTLTDYDLAGKVVRITYPDNYTATYAYHPGSGLLKTVTGSDGVVYATYSNYQATGKIGQIDNQNGAETVYTYDPSSTRLTGLVTGNTAGATLQNRHYTYTLAGDVATIADQLSGTTYNYAYDSMHRLSTETNTGLSPAVSYAYSPIGNITNKTVGATSLTYAYATARKHAVSQVTVNGTPYAFTYDANGNLTDGFDLTNLSGVAARHIDYNGDNMPITITRAGVTTSIIYDGGGARARKVSPSGTTYYYGEHYEIENGVATKYVLAGGERIAKVAPTATSYFHKDHLGSATVLTNVNGASAEGTEYMPFGEMRSHTGTTTSNYKFTGQELDPETGLYNYNARLYDPTLGRFISADTVVQDYSDPQTLNRYSYCQNNPLAYVDPSGHFNLWKEITRPFKQMYNEFNREFHNYGPTIAAIGVAAVVGPWAGAYISGLAMPAGYGCGMVSASTVAGWEMAGSIGGAIITGAASGVAAGGLSAAMNGGNIGDWMLKGAGYGAAISGTLADLSEAAGYMRNVMIEQSKLNHFNAMGKSVGFMGDSFKLGGGRWVEGLDLKSQVPSYLGGLQGGQGSLFGFPYSPGSIADYVVEAFAGPHDFLNSGYWYNSMGNAKALTGFAGYFGEAINYSNVILATPIVAASVVPTSMYPMVVSYSLSTHN